MKCQDCIFVWANCTKVLSTIELGNTEELSTRKYKYIANKASECPEEINKFVLIESNSRAVPRQEQRGQCGMVLVS